MRTPRTPVGADARDSTQRTGLSASCPKRLLAKKLTACCRLAGNQSAGGANISRGLHGRLADQCAFAIYGARRVRRASLSARAEIADALAIAAALAIATPVEALTLNIVAIGVHNTMGVGRPLGEFLTPPCWRDFFASKASTPTSPIQAFSLTARAGCCAGLISPSQKEPILSSCNRAATIFAFGIKEERTANITAMVNRLLARRIYSALMHAWPKKPPKTVI